MMIDFVYGSYGVHTVAHTVAWISYFRGIARHAWPRPSRMPDKSRCKLFKETISMSGRLLSVCSSGVSMESERLDSSALGSFAPSAELDTEVVMHGMVNAESVAAVGVYISPLTRTHEEEAAAPSSCKHTDAKAKNTHARISIS
jgi:hypothetical protein